MTLTHTETERRAFAALGPTALASEPGEHATAALAEADRTPTPEPSR